MADDADVIIVGAGLAGLVAAAELAEAGKKIIIVDQEPEQSLGGQAFWSFGGLFLVDSPEQRRMRIRDSHDLALEDWMGTAAFDRPEDFWPRKWAEAYVGFAAGEKRSWLIERGLKFFPVVGWAERGGGNAIGHGNSVPRFHVTWGTGPGVLEPFVLRVREAAMRGLVQFKFRHRVNELTRTGTTVDGVRGDILEPSSVERGRKSARDIAGDFELHAQAVIVASGGIGANHELVRKNWPERLGKAPSRMITGVPDHVDGRMLAITEAAGGRVINRDRMWHYVEGIKNWAPIWTDHAIRILPGPSSLWLDARGKRLPVPLYPGFDTLGTLSHIMRTGFDYSWFILTRKIIQKEFALSGSEQNPDLTGKSWRQVLGRATSGIPGPVKAFMEKGEDFIVEADLSTLVKRMNALAGGEPLLEEAQVEREIRARDRQLDNPFSKDMQITALRGARAYLGDKLIRTAKPHKMLDPANGPLIAVRLNILTRKTLGGLQTDLDSRVLDAGGLPVPGLYAVGEAAGFGGGGLHGYAALEGTFLGGCIFSGRSAGRSAGGAVV
ncbi:FAD-binding dehydrogenase [Mesorhizobium sp. M4B.F.Ca.ET.215.01.1.1]|uniref:FAD-binding dehydrogenase n=1 Tax=unclassified Mesorhizobium TaxID=325217 RepID=UPI000FCA49CE|nr:MULTISPECIES: FAD-binding dehydrogenase [unclassified Mesorhizobium]RUW25598.1 FAD-binding dehydrogenase [Mesorhizobium sp. M4B.F.Ca.ET.013.02.1.1]RVD42883.1 FAD-binding dehydrogenase [Mesorhizobium sp. M4B.F.Ca.ET.019.03.1.1]TGQ06225.1 FAD-binding dehydrogenase [Mesorhizobium sp. M4B.F.Ca.ET.215.01.1.1]TGQ32619.1 FAD-binding dehydrogenase [Mesorhizobium sp. M00.F.Ca.ET.220.01.1.1]TGQ98833.1 FAD-binding dehydrogenase [Mesorhizobium sp. M4B.F.Ca.ET.203.01.1.1]